MWGANFSALRRQQSSECLYLMPFEWWGFACHLWEQVLILSLSGCQALFLPKLPRGSFPILVQILLTPALMSDLLNAWGHHLQINILFLEVVISPGVWNANSTLFGFPRFLGLSAQFIKLTGSSWVPLPYPVAWKLFWGHHWANYGIHFVLQLPGVTVLFCQYHKNHCFIHLVHFCCCFGRR